MMKNFYLLFLLCSLSMMTAKAQVTDILTGLNYPYGVALDGNELYISELSSSRIIKIDITAAVPPAIQEVLTGLSGPAGLFIEENTLYFSEFSASRVSSIDVTDAPPVPDVIPVTFSGAASLFIDGDILYVSLNNASSVVSINLTDDTPLSQTIANAIDTPNSIVKFGNALYVASFLTNSIIKIDITQTPAVVTTAVSGVSSPVGLTLDGSFLYIAGADKISRIDLNDPSPMLEEVVAGLSGAQSVAFNGVDMYIAQIGNGGSGQGKISKLVVNTPVFSTLPNVCLDGSPTMLGGASPSSGVYSGPGVTDNGDGSTFSFDPVAAGGVGTYTVTYSLGGEMVTSTITVVAAPTVTFSTGGLSVQVDAGVQTGLSGGMPAGGVYSGNGVTDDGNGMTYSFDPAVAGEGENVITYTYADANGCGGEQGAVITVTALAVPGDLCDEAIDISAQFGGPFNEPQTTNMFNNTNFTTGADDPTAGFDCFYEGDQLQNSGWFSFTGDGNTYRMRSIQCTGPNENLDLQVVVYSGGCGSLMPVACNEDENGAIGIFNVLVEFPTEEGVEYVVLIDGYDGTTGEFCLEVTNLTEPLPGDECADAIDINNLFGQAEMVPQLSELYDNNGYSVSGTDPTSTVCGIGFNQASPIWFAFTGDGNRYTIDNANSSIDLVAVIYSGECEVLTEVDCGFDAVNPVFDFQTEEGVEYLLIVSNDDLDATGTFNLEVTNQGSVGVTNISETALRVYPNPTQGMIQLPQINLERVEAYDATGRLVVSQLQPGTSIDLGAQPAGLYILKMYAGEEVYSAKVVKE
ncbi:T9SS type A sorting domain-containing protein [Lewinella sp. LCG006]|uniref:T9SS type A sorting domain-containing protein n=1 Tax=Lewinella sp. LCG006 TaxID=3231911 RepID=UPI003460BEB1